MKDISRKTEQFTDSVIRRMTRIFPAPVLLLQDDYRYRFHSPDRSRPSLFRPSEKLFQQAFCLPCRYILCFVRQYSYRTYIRT